MANFGFAALAAGAGFPSVAVGVADNRLVWRAVRQLDAGWERVEEAFLLALDLALDPYPVAFLYLPVSFCALRLLPLRRRLFLLLLRQASVLLGGP